MTTSLVDNPKGKFRFLKSAGPFSLGVVADPGYEVVHATFESPVPLEKGFERVEAHLRKQGRPPEALCAVELRIPEPLSVEGFAEFNRPYRQRLADLGAQVGEHITAARSNLAPAAAPVSEPGIYAFSYTVPSDDSGPTFVVSGVAEVKPKPEGGFDIVCPGDVSPQGMGRKVEFTLEALGGLLQALGADWKEVTTANVYTVHAIESLIRSAILPVLRAAAGHGVRLYHCRPPVAGLDFEMDVRAVRQELLLPA